MAALESAPGWAWSCPMLEYEELSEGGGRLLVVVSNEVSLRSGA